MHIHMHMAKNVALSEKAYSEMLKIKKSGESFSEVVLRLMRNREKADWRDSIGALKNDKDAERIYKNILAERHKKPARLRRLKW